MRERSSPISHTSKAGTAASSAANTGTSTEEPARREAPGRSGTEATEATQATQATETTETEEAPGTPERAGKVNINTAGAKELETLPGIGPKKAQSILDYRSEHGAFASVEELIRVSGIGKATMDKLRDRVTT